MHERKIHNKAKKEVTEIFRPCSRPVESEIWVWDSVCCEALEGSATPSVGRRTKVCQHYFRKPKQRAEPLNSCEDSVAIVT